MDELTISGKKYISSKRAAQITGYAKDYIGQLARSKKIEATQVGRAWYVLEGALLGHQGAQQTLENTQPIPQASRTGALSSRLYSVRQIADIPKTWSRVNYHEDRGPLLPSISAKRDEMIITEEHNENNMENKDRSDVYSHTTKDISATKIAVTVLGSLSPEQEKMSGIRLPEVHQNPLTLKREKAIAHFPLRPALLVVAGVSLLVLVPLSGLFVAFEVDYEASASSQTATASVGFDYVQIFLGATVGVLDAFFQSIFASFGLYFQTGIDFILALPSRLNEIVRFFGI